MKGGFFGLRGKELSFILIIFVCTTILIWAWEKTPILTAVLPPKSRLLKLFPGNGTVNENSDVSTAAGPTKSSPYSITTPVENEEIFSSRSEAKERQKQILVADKDTIGESPTEVENSRQSQGEKDSIEKEQGVDLAPEIHAYTSPSLSRQDDKNLTAVADNQEKSTHAAETEERQKQILEADKNAINQNPTDPTGLEQDKRQFKEEKNSREKELNVNLAPEGHPNASFSLSSQDHTNFTAVTDNQACDLAKGKWVIDDRRPLYSGSRCTRWLSQMWACRLMQREDFSYERLKWQPKHCEIEEFTGPEFLRRMQDKSLAFVGDSLGRQQFQSLMCMITGGKESPDVKDVGKEYGLSKPRGAVRPNGWAYHFPSTNTTVLYYWSACLCDLEPINATNPATNYAMHLDRPPAFLRQFLHKFHILVLNTGHHWNRGKLTANRWVMYVGGLPNTDRKIAQIGGAKHFTIHSIVKWVDSQLPSHPHLKAFYRSISPRHFVNGDWNTGGSCDNSTPMSVGKEVLQDESSDHSASSAVKGTGVELLDITALSQLRDEGHISRYSITASRGVQDCLHWCLPGVPDTWNEILFAKLILHQCTRNGSYSTC
ncbi:protein trichome birefringence-like 16 [Tripterygium wilfordii]|nr:protein trichome birefringence-like 16 [Tripterygium wilfordii]